jgi:hypothetical protein
VLLLAGRSSAPADAAALEPDFDRMLSLLVLGDEGQGLSMKGGHSCGLHGASPSSTPDSAGSAGEAPSGELPEATPELEVPIIQEDVPGLPDAP